jgi:hypothetical protein
MIGKMRKGQIHTIVLDAVSASVRIFPDKRQKQKAAPAGQGIIAQGKRYSAPPWVNVLPQTQAALQGQEKPRSRRSWRTQKMLQCMP